MLKKLVRCRSDMRRLFLIVTGIVVAASVAAHFVPRGGDAVRPAPAPAAARPVPAAHPTAPSGSPRQVVAQIQMGESMAFAAEADGDEQIRRWLAGDPELRRAAAELVNDPDPALRGEARQLLSELGLAVTHD
jgi:hypothetical protein